MEVSLEEARSTNPEAQVGDMLEKETTPADFGRIAAQTAKQVVMQRIREAERDRVFGEFSDREGDIVLANMQRQDQNGNWILEVGRAEAILPPNHQVKQRAIPLRQPHARAAAGSAEEPEGASADRVKGRPGVPAQAIRA